MGMTIEDCISKVTEILEEATEDENAVCYVTDVDEPTLKMAIDTMRKYQKMQGVLDEIREQIKSHLRGVEITLEVLVENHPLRPKMEGAKDTLEECLELIDKAESEETDG